MKLLIIHNDYQTPGGELNSVNSIRDLNIKNGNIVLEYRRHNNEINKYRLLNKLLFPINSIFSIKSYNDIKRILKSNPDVDIVQIHNIFPLISYASYFAVKQYSRAKIIQYIHNYRLFCINGLFLCNGKLCEKCSDGKYTRSIINKCYKDSYFLSLLYVFILKLYRSIKTYDKPNLFIAVSNFVKEKLINNGIPEGKIQVLYHYISTPSIKSYNKNSNYSVYMGRLSSEKGISTLVEAFKEFPEYKLKIMGSGKLHSDIEKYITSNKISNIELLGYVTGAEKENILKNSLFNIVSSQCYETFGRSVIEGFAFGIPVLASSIAGLKELVEVESNGMLYKYDDINDLKDKIKYMFNNIELLDIMSDYCYKQAKEKFSDKVFFQKIKNIYNNVIAEY